MIADRYDSSQALCCRYATLRFVATKQNDLEPATFDRYFRHIAIIQNYTQTSVQVTLDHFVMVRIHARQPTRDQVVTDHHQKRGKDIDWVGVGIAMARDNQSRSVSPPLRLSPQDTLKAFPGALRTPPRPADWFSVDTTRIPLQTFEIPYLYDEAMEALTRSGELPSKAVKGTELFVLMRSRVKAWIERIHSQLDKLGIFFPDKAGQMAEVR
jgi:hypothetical protein